VPFVGTRDVAADLAPMAVMPSLETEALVLPDCRQLQLIYEIDETAMLDLIPPALHPTIPPTVMINVLAADDGPLGGFTLVLARIGCRSGARPRGLTIHAVCDGAEAAAALSTRWGFPIVQGDASLTRNYDRIRASAGIDGELVLDAELMNPEPINGQDILYLANLNVAKIRREGAEQVRLVQVDPEYVFKSADRGEPQLLEFDEDVFNLPGCEPIWPVSASYTTVDVHLPEIRYLVDPAKGPMDSVEKL
jgi:Acetoacetate decarboxylase (ADC)